MRRKARVSFGGKTVDGDVIPVDESTERWSNIKLEDGTTIRLKPVVTDVIRLEGVFDSDGQPVYVVKSTNVVAVAAPSNLLKPALVQPEQIQ